MTYRPRVLFVCEHDAGAARMCAAYLEQMAGDRYEALAAALDPSPGVRPEAAAALSEEGVDLTDGPGLAMTSDLADIVDRIVTLGFTLNPEVARDVAARGVGHPRPRRAADPGGPGDSRHHPPPRREAGRPPRHRGHRPLTAR